MLIYVWNFKYEDFIVVANYAIYVQSQMIEPAKLLQIVPAAQEYFNCLPLGHTVNFGDISELSHSYTPSTYGVSVGVDLLLPDITVITLVTVTVKIIHRREIVLEGTELVYDKSVTKFMELAVGLVLSK
ncbi:hypothetical protein K7432_015344 [Basidiobolus ranarum]|uniref:Uncharacterized protein n=1 Tax=Basidiobolus ranarum TaxID=34480 RepID=A0ABR2VN80_9FUNG